MIRNILYILLGSVLFYSTNGFSQSANSVELHLQFYDHGVCYPMEISSKYPPSQHLKTKAVLQSLAYYSTIYVEVISKDTADLKPSSNHELQSSSLKLNPNLEYDIIVYKYDGYNKAEPELMTVKTSKLEHDAQLIIPFKKGSLNLKEMKYFKELKSDTQPDFRTVAEKKELNNNLKLDNTAYFPNGDIKANYYIVADNFPLYFVKEFDSLNKNNYSQGLRLLTNYKQKAKPTYTPIWSDSDNTKYGYWEYFKNDILVKHELWASAISQQFVWYSSGKLKSSIDFGRYSGRYNNSRKYIQYLENGLIKEEAINDDQPGQYIIKSNIYSSTGTLIQRNFYKSFNGFTKEDLYKREIFYPSGKIKIEETLGRYYNINYYKEDGTTKGR